MKKKIHPVIVVLAILAIVFIHVVWWFFVEIGSFFYLEGPHRRSDFTAKQQVEIARALGFDIAPGETLTVYYYAGFWPKTVGQRYEGYWEGYWGDISGIASEEEFLSRCHEETAFFWENHYDHESGESTYRAEFSTYRENWEIAIAVMKQVQGKINNLILPYVVHVILWGLPVAEIGLIVTLIIIVVRKRRRSKKEKAVSL